MANDKKEGGARHLAEIEHVISRAWQAFNRSQEVRTSDGVILPDVKVAGDPRLLLLIVLMYDRKFELLQRMDDGELGSSADLIAELGGMDLDEAEEILRGADVPDFDALVARADEAMREFKAARESLDEN